MSANSVNWLKLSTITSHVSVPSQIVVAAGGLLALHGIRHNRTIFDLYGYISI